MTSKRLISLALAALVAALVSACSDRAKTPETAAKEMPAVNDENCKPTNVANVDTSVRQQFANACARRGTFKPSEKKEW